MQRKWYFIGTLIIAFCLGMLLVLPIWDKKSGITIIQEYLADNGSKSVGDDVPPIPEPYIYTDFIPPQNSFGMGETTFKEVNWSYFKELFNQHCDWLSEYKRYSYSSWVDGSDYLTIEKSWNDTLGGWKFNLILDVPVHVYSARFTFACDLAVLDYVERDGWQVNLNYTVPNTDEVYNVFFNWSDMAGIPNIIFNKGVQDNHFWFRFRRDNIPAGHYEFDPTFGHSESGTQGAIGISSYEYYRGIWATMGATDGTADSITVKFGTLDSTESYQCALYQYIDYSSNYCGNLIATTETKQILSNGDNYEFTFDFSEPKPSLTASTNYYLICRMTTTNSASNYIVAKSEAGYGVYKYFTVPTAFENNDPWTTETASSYKVWVYCTYTEDDEEPERTEQQVLSGWFSGNNISTNQQIITGFFSGNNISTLKQLITGYFTGGNASSDTQVIQGFFSGNNISTSKQITQGWFSGGNTSTNQQVLSGWFSGNAIDRTNQQIEQGYFTGGNTSTNQQIIQGWFSGNNVSSVQQILQGWFSGGNTSSNKQAIQGYFTGGNASSGTQTIQGYFTGGNATSSQQVLSGWFSGNSGDRAYQQVTQGWFSGNNVSALAQMLSGWYSGGNVSTNAQILSGWFSGDATDRTNQQTVQGYFTGGNVTSSYQITQGWFSGGNTTVLYINISNTYPTNNTLINHIVPSIYFTINQTYGQDMNYTVFWNTSGNVDLQFVNAQNITNGTYYNSYNNASSYGGWYYWRIQADDGVHYINETYKFKTTYGTPFITQPTSSIFVILGVFGIIGVVVFILIVRKKKQESEYYDDYYNYRK